VVGRYVHRGDLSNSRQSAAAPGSLRLLAHVPEKWEPVLRIQHAQDQGTWSAGSAFRACALHAAQPRGTEPYAAPRSRSNRAIAARSSPMPVSVRAEVSTTSG